jgi:hypothetical protein
MVIKMMKNKKGIVFTILALIISSFILIMFFYIIEMPVDYGVDVTRMKIRTTNNFIDQSDDIVRTQAIISSKKAITTLINEIETDDFFPDFDLEFASCLTTGNFSSSSDCGDNTNLKELVEENLTTFLREHMGLDAEFEIRNVRLDQTNPWELEVHLDFTMKIEEELMSWRITESINESFTILGFKDPIKVNKDTSVSSYTPENDVINIGDRYKAINDEWMEVPSTLNSLVMNGNYFEYDLGISFLNRLKGNLTPSNLGIVSIEPIIIDGGNVVRSGSSSLDWHFWQNETPLGSTYGEYNFSSMLLPSRIAILGQTNLDTTIHGTIIPEDLASSANMSNSTYFN